MQPESDALYELSTLLRLNFENVNAESSSLDGQVSTSTFGDYFKNYVSETELPSFALEVISHFPGVQFAISWDSKLIAILAKNELEIRSTQDHFQAVAAKTLVLPDAHPKWRKLSWSKSGSELLLARSTAVLDVLDVSGGPAYSIEVKTGVHGFVISDAVCALETKVLAADSAFTDALFVLQFSGVLHSYLIGSGIAGYQPTACFDFQTTPLFASSLLVLQQHDLLVLGSCYETTGRAEPHAAVDVGLTIWRRLDTEPFFSRVSTVADELALARRARRGVFSFFTQQKVCVMQMCANGDETQLALFLSTGAIALCQLPSLSLLRFWSLKSQNIPAQSTMTVEPDLKAYGRYPVGLAWWSSAALVVARANGAVQVCSTDETMDDALEQNPENFAGWSQLFSVAPGYTPQNIFSRLAELMLDMQNVQMMLKSVRGATVCSLPALREHGGETWLKFALSLLSMSVKLVVHAAFGRQRQEAPDGDDVTAGAKPNAERGVVMRLCELKSITPQELFKKKLASEEYGEALLLAEAYDLDVDPVYQRRWQKTTMSKHSIKDFLMKVKDVHWVLDECVEKVPSDAETCYRLLEYGLKLTAVKAEKDDVRAEEKLSASLSKKNKLDELAENECKARLQMLFFMDMLNDYEEIVRLDRTESFRAETYGRIRRMCLLELALEVARQSKFVWLKSLLTHHYSQLMPHLLVLLNNVPEVVGVDEFTTLLPTLDKSTELVRFSVAEKTWRLQADWVEESAEESASKARKFFESQWLQSEEVYKRDSSLHAQKQWISESGFFAKDLVERWCRERTEEIERLTGIPMLARDFLAGFVRNGFSSLQLLLDELEMFCTIVYECGSDMPLSQFRKLTEAEVADVIVGEATGDEFVRRCEQLLLQYFHYAVARARVSSPTAAPLAVNKLMYDFILRRALTDMRFLFVIVRACKQPSTAPRLFGLDSSAQLVRLVLDVAYASERDDQVDIVMKIIGLLASDESPELDLLAAQLRSLETLNLYGVRLAVAQLGEAVASEEYSLVVLRRIVRGQVQRILAPLDVKQKRPTTGVLRQTLTDMMELRREVFVRVSEQQCLEIFVEGALAGGDERVIEFAGEFMQVGATTRTPMKVPFQRALGLIVDAAKDYFNGARDARDPMIGLARRCLSLTTERPEQIANELDLIQALTLLEELKLVALPLQVRLAADKTGLVEKVLQVNAGAYTDIKRMLKLANLLHIDGDDEVSRKGKVLLLCAERAYALADLPICVKYCKEMVHLSYTQAWALCKRVGTMQEAKLDDDAFVDERLALLNFALIHCDAAEIEGVLACSRKLKLRRKLDELASAPTNAMEWSPVVGVESKAAPSRVESKAGPSPVEPKAGPSLVEPKAAPTRVEAKVAPTRVESKEAGSSRVESKVEPSLEESKAAPTRVKSKAPPSRVEPKAGPSLVEPKAAPSRVESEAAASLVEPKAAPSLVEPKAPPTRAESKAPPSRVESKAAASLVEPRAAPSRVESKVAPTRVESTPAVAPVNFRATFVQEVDVEPSGPRQRRNAKAKVD